MPSVATTSKKTNTKKVSKPVKKPAVEVEPSKSYKELITEALVSLKERKGTSRPALKKYIREKYPKIGSATNFDLYFNNAIKKGVETGDFDQPKGPSGTLKLVKKSNNAHVTTTTSSTTSVPTKSVTKKNVSKKSPSPTEKKNVARKSSSPIANPTYKEMISKAIMELNDGKGSSRSALKKYVKDQYPSTGKSNSNFDHLFNSAIKKGVDSGDFAQPKGPSGVVKMIKKSKNKTLTQKKTV